MIEQAMASLTSAASLFPATRLPPLKPTASPFLKPSRPKTPDKRRRRRRIGNGAFRAELSNDAPIAAAIGACMLSSLVLPVAAGSEDEEDGTAVGSSTDTRFAVMGIVSFIPYFNWLSWVFAWLDTGKRRYAVYALVYLAPYLRSNLSLSPEESWLPIASILFCIVHVQLEASLRNGDIEGFQLFNEAAKLFSSISGKKDDHQGFSENRRKNMNLPSSDTQARNEIRQWDVPRRPSRDEEHMTGDWDDNETREK